MDELGRFQLLDKVLSVMGDSGAGEQLHMKPLDIALSGLAIILNLEWSAEQRDKLFGEIISSDPNSMAQLRLGRFLRRCDAAEHLSELEATEPFSTDRRKLVYSLLRLPPEVAGKLSAIVPIAEPETPLVIAAEHTPWYTPERRALHQFYWNAYKQYLLDKLNWHHDAVDKLDDSSNAIVERLSDPEGREIYPVKGLVVGYVQSGKTANFTAVTAKAADAGYRLIIILAGTLNILREQTQRRLDRELIGQELIMQESGGEGLHDYAGDADWDRFIKHRKLPSQLGAFDWERFTGATEDYKRLNKGIRALKWTKRYEGRPLNNPANLHGAPARLIVLKKTPVILNRLIHDLKAVQGELQQVPALIIDDESDQASVNTRPPSQQEERDRTATNQAIIDLIRVLPRAQYVGYTATPFANVFINPDDDDDLFPKDFIVALGRPDGYMGVSDFFDFDSEFRPLGDDEIPESYHSKERAFVRSVYGDNDQTSGNLPKAIDSFVLSGALKLFREDRGTRLSTRHHTMLVHTSTRQATHERDLELVRESWDSNDYSSRASYDRLQQLWEEDFRPVSQVQGKGLPFPECFSELRPYIDKCLERVAGQELVRIVNSSPQHEGLLPNFDRDSVWSILVGGAKLSRGYTIEGLTISYYRRKIKTADTLMQVGRWFGFRKGYRDLVRLFIGREEPDGKNRTMDLYEAFKSICQDEEQFRKELRRYVAGGDPPIRPRDVPPLVPSHMLTPTARNKMYHAQIAKQNFGAEWKERVQVTDTAQGRNHNAALFRELVSNSSFLGLKALGCDTAGGWRGYVAEVPPQQFLSFAEQYKWRGDAPLMYRELEFLRGTGEWDPELDRWLIVMPIKQQADNIRWPLAEYELSVFRRKRTGSGAFSVFSEPRHRLIAEHLAMIKNCEAPTLDTTSLRSSRQGIMLAYPVIGTSDQTPPDGLISDDNIAIGFGLQFPGNSIRVPVTFSV